MSFLNSHCSGAAHDSSKKAASVSTGLSYATVGICQWEVSLNVIQGKEEDTHIYFNGPVSWSVGHVFYILAL